MSRFVPNRGRVGAATSRTPIARADAYLPRRRTRAIICPGPASSEKNLTVDGTWKDGEFEASGKTKLKPASKVQT